MEPIAPRVARPKSTPIMGSNHVGYGQVDHGSTGNLATAGESTRNQETGYENRKIAQPMLDKNSEALFNSYPSLRKAVANAARRFDFIFSSVVKSLPTRCKQNNMTFFKRSMPTI